MTLDRLKATWERLGKDDPLWAVLTDPDRRHGRWDVDEFLDAGHQPIDTVRELVEEAQLALGGRVLDFGCGAGRLSNALAEHVEQVVGIDIAESMVQQARQIARFPDRIEFVHYDGARLPFPDCSFDSAVSLIVLQHARPAVQMAALLELLRVVRPGGALVLQIPSEPRLPQALDHGSCQAEIEVLEAPAVLAVGTAYTVRTRVWNRGTGVWPTHRKIKLANHWFKDSAMAVQDDGRSELPVAVAPGESIELDLVVTAPAEPGKYELHLDVVQELVSWWADLGSPVVTVAVDVRAEAVAPVTASVDAAAVRTTTTSDATEPVAPESNSLSGIEMHGLHSTLVRSMVEHTGSHVAAMVEDSLAGEEWESFVYVIRRGD